MDIAPENRTDHTVVKIHLKEYHPLCCLLLKRGIKLSQTRLHLYIIIILFGSLQHVAPSTGISVPTELSLALTVYIFMRRESSKHHTLKFNNIM